MGFPGEMRGGLPLLGGRPVAVAEDVTDVGWLLALLGLVTAGRVPREV